MVYLCFYKSRLGRMAACLCDMATCLCSMATCLCSMAACLCGIAMCLCGMAIRLCGMAIVVHYVVGLHSHAEHGNEGGRDRSRERKRRTASYRFCFSQHCANFYNGKLHPLFEPC